LSGNFQLVPFLSADIGGKLRCDWLTAAIGVNKMANVEWTDALVYKLIELYEQFPCLYDISSEDYRNKIKKRRHEEEISAQLGISGICFLKSVVTALREIRTSVSCEHGNGCAPT